MLENSQSVLSFDKTPTNGVPFINTINTNGMVTLTVVGGDDHLPALAPNDSATIEIKLPTSGPTIQAAFAQNSYTIDESIGQLDLGVVFTIGPGRRGPQV